MKVEVWADVVCPWCSIGKNRLDKALAGFEHRAEVEVVYRAFQLDPSAAPGPGRPVREMLQAKYGLTDAQVEATTKRITDLATAEGLAPFRPAENRTGNTALAHQLLLYAAERGLGAALWDRLYRAYFGEVRTVYGVEELVALAAEVGVDAAGAREALESGRYVAQVRAEGEEARQLGATGVPFFVIDRKYAVAGAMSVQTLRGAMERAWEERAAPPV